MEQASRLQISMMALLLWAVVCPATATLYDDHALASERHPARAQVSRAVVVRVPLHDGPVSNEPSVQYGMTSLESHRYENERQTPGQPQQQQQKLVIVLPPNPNQGISSDVPRQAQASEIHEHYGSSLGGHGESAPPPTYSVYSPVAGQSSSQHEHSHSSPRTAQDQHAASTHAYRQPSESAVNQGHAVSSHTFKVTAKETQHAQQSYPTYASEKKRLHASQQQQASINPAGYNYQQQQHLNQQQDLRPTYGGTYNRPVAEHSSQHQHAQEIYGQTKPAVQQTPETGSSYDSQEEDSDVKSGPSSSHVPLILITLKKNNAKEGNHYDSSPEGSHSTTGDQHSGQSVSRHVPARTSSLDSKGQFSTYTSSQTSERSAPAHSSTQGPKHTGFSHSSGYTLSPNQQMASKSHSVRPSASYNIAPVSSHTTDLAQQYRNVPSKQSGVAGHTETQSSKYGSGGHSQTPYYTSPGQSYSAGVSEMCADGSGCRTSGNSYDETRRRPSPAYGSDSHSSSYHPPSKSQTSSYDTAQKSQSSNHDTTTKIILSSYNAAPKSHASSYNSATNTHSPSYSSTPQRLNSGYAPAAVKQNTKYGSVSQPRPTSYSTVPQSESSSYTVNSPGHTSRYASGPASQSSTYSAPLPSSSVNPTSSGFAPYNGYSSPSGHNSYIKKTAAQNSKPTPTASSSYGSVGYSQTNYGVPGKNHPKGFDLASVYGSSVSAYDMKQAMQSSTGHQQQRYQNHPSKYESGSSSWENQEDRTRASSQYPSMAQAEWEEKNHAPAQQDTTENWPSKDTSVGHRSNSWSGTEAQVQSQDLYPQDQSSGYLYSSQQQQQSGEGYGVGYPVHQQQQQQDSTKMSSESSQVESVGKATALNKGGKKSSRDRTKGVVLLLVGGDNDDEFRRRASEEEMLTSEDEDVQDYEHPVPME